MAADDNPLVLADVTAQAQVHKSRVYFKAHQFPDWYYVDMKVPSQPHYQALLPQPLPDTEKVDYYIHALDTTLETARTDQYEPGSRGSVACTTRGRPRRRWIPEEATQIVIGGTKEGQSPSPARLQQEGDLAFVAVTGAVITGAALLTAADHGDCGHGDGHDGRQRLRPRRLARRPRLRTATTAAHGDHGCARRPRRHDRCGDGCGYDGGLRLRTAAGTAGAGAAGAGTAAAAGGGAAAAGGGMGAGAIAGIVGGGVLVVGGVALLGLQGGQQRGRRGHVPERVRDSRRRAVAASSPWGTRPFCTTWSSCGRRSIRACVSNYCSSNCSIYYEFQDGARVTCTTGSAATGDYSSGIYSCASEDRESSASSRRRPDGSLPLCPERARVDAPVVEHDGQRGGPVRGAVVAPCAPRLAQRECGSADAPSATAARRCPPSARRRVAQRDGADRERRGRDVEEGVAQDVRVAAPDHGRCRLDHELGPGCGGLRGPDLDARWVSRNPRGVTDVGAVEGSLRRERRRSPRDRAIRGRCGARDPFATDLAARRRASRRVGSPRGSLGRGPGVLLDPSPARRSRVRAPMVSLGKCARDHEGRGRGGGWQRRRAAVSRWRAEASGKRGRRMREPQICVARQAQHQRDSHDRDGEQPGPPRVDGRPTTCGRVAVVAGTTSSPRPLAGR